MLATLGVERIHVLAFTKYFITAAVVVLVSELAKRSDKLVALVAALPLVTILTLICYTLKTNNVQVPIMRGIHLRYVVPTILCFLCFQSCYRATVLA